MCVKFYKGKAKLREGASHWGLEEEPEPEAGGWGSASQQGPARIEAGVSQALFFFFSI